MCDLDQNTAIAKKCVLAADIDRTLLGQHDGERELFLLDVVNTLVRAAALGADLAFLTGNSMDQLARRFLRPLVERLCETDRLCLLNRMHFFCNSSGVHAQFPLSHEKLQRFCNRNSGVSGSQNGFGCVSPEEILGVMLQQNQIASDFLDIDYLERTRIAADDASVIRSILQRASVEYLEHVTKDMAKLKKTYTFDFLTNSDGSVTAPNVEVREVHHERIPGRPLTVQITLKPVLSFRHARAPEKFVGADVRTNLIKSIQKELDEHGLGHYIARPGGRASIDVTLEKLDKSFGLRWLISRLNAEGSERLDQEYGSNTLYFGDEVIVGGGNDYAITKIPGVLVFAVNEDCTLVPFRSGVVVPWTHLHGPRASARILEDFVRECENLEAHRNAWRQSEATAVQVFREVYFKHRVRDTLDRLYAPGMLQPWAWQALHAFVTLVAQDNPRAQRWTEILRTQLDAISVDAEMTELSGRAIVRGDGDDRRINRSDVRGLSLDAAPDPVQPRSRRPT